MPRSAEKKYLVRCTESEVLSLLADRIKKIVEGRKKRNMERSDEISFPQLTAICNLLICWPWLSNNVVNYLARKLAAEGYGSISFRAEVGVVFKAFPSRVTD